MNTKPPGDDGLFTLIETYNRLTTLSLDADDAQAEAREAGQEDAKFLQASQAAIEAEIDTVYAAISEFPARTLAGILAKLDFAGVPTEDHYMVACAREDLRRMVGPEVGGDPRPRHDPDEPV